MSAATLSPRAVVVALTGKAVKKHQAATPNENGRFEVRRHVTQESQEIGAYFNISTLWIY